MLFGRTMWFQKRHSPAHRLTSFPLSLHRKSTGTIRLASNDPFANPVIDPKYYSDPADIETMYIGARFIRELAAQAPLANHAVADSWPQRDPHVDQNLDVNSSEYIQSVLKYATKTIYHPMGTAKMGIANDPMAVVSSTLEVFGTNGLRVVDLSITPSVRCLHTQANLFTSRYGLVTPMYRGSFVVIFGCFAPIRPSPATPMPLR